MLDRVLVLGLGNEYLRDDGVGLAAARRVSELRGGEADLVEACVATVDLLPVITGYDRVVVLDAYMSPDRAPGESVHVAGEDLPRGFGYRSFHTLPFGEMLRLGNALGMPMPREISVHGLCVEDAETFGTEFTEVVAEAWQPWAEAVAEQEFGDLVGGAAPRAKAGGGSSG